MKYFLLKLNGNDSPSRIAKPKDSGDWEGRTCRLQRIGQNALPNPGDALIIWVNERRGGTGLTAFATCESVEASGAIFLSRVELAPAGRVNNAYADSHPIAPFPSIRGAATTSCRELAKSEWNTLVSAVGRRSKILRTPLLIFRVGYMEAYDGPGPIKSGGAHITAKGEGGEMWNFAPTNGRCCGYVMTRHFAGIDITRIGRSLGNNVEGPALKGVDIAFIARKPGVGQVVVGAYMDATVFNKEYRNRLNPSPDRKHRNLDYLCETLVSNAYLVPPAQRNFPIPYAPKDGEGFPGHANVWYGDNKREDVSAFKRRLQTYLRLKAQELPNMGNTTAVQEAVLEDEEREELERIATDKRIRETGRWALVNARIGQGLFRKRVESIEKGCRVTGIANRELLRASHIRPWARSNNREKLDGENGFLLAPHIDHLFDKGYITFSDRGNVVISQRLPDSIIREWRLRSKCRGKPFTPRQRKYLRYHREKIFK